MDVLSQLIANEMARRLVEQQVHVPYGVWIEGQGWLKNEQGRVFADLHREVAQSAAELWGTGARVTAIDLPDATGRAALEGFEKQFLEQQAKRRASTWWERWTALFSETLNNVLSRHTL